MLQFLFFFKEINSPTIELAFYYFSEPYDTAKIWELRVKNKESLENSQLFVGITFVIKTSRCLKIVWK